MSGRLFQETDFVSSACSHPCASAAALAKAAGRSGDMCSVCSSEPGEHVAIHVRGEEHAGPWALSWGSCLGGGSLTCRPKDKD